MDSKNIYICTFLIYIKWNFVTSMTSATMLILENITHIQFRVPLVEQVLLILLEHMISPPVFSGVHVTRSLVLCVMFCRSLFILLSIVLSVLRFTDSDYPTGILKLFLNLTLISCIFFSLIRVCVLIFLLSFHIKTNFFTQFLTFLGFPILDIIANNANF